MERPSPAHVRAAVASGVKGWKGWGSQAASRDGFVAAAPVVHLSGCTGRLHGTWPTATCGGSGRLRHSGPRLSGLQAVYNEGQPRRVALSCRVTRVLRSRGCVELRGFVARGTQTRARPARVNFTCPQDQSFLATSIPYPAVD